jgi:SAM-dependent methyltransferase
MKPKTAKEILNNVKESYTKIADEFDLTRKRPWPEFKYFKEYINENDTVLDIGCGNGRLYEFLKDISNIKYIGIDNNTELIRLAQKNYPSANFLVGNLLDLPVKAKADVALSVASLHHIPSSSLRKKSIQEIHEKLKSDGVLEIIVWNLFQNRYIKYILKSLFKFIIHLGKYDWNDTFIPWGNSGVLRYYHAFTPRELKKLLKRNNFSIIDMFYSKKGEKTGFFNSYNICVICRKK